MKDEYVRYEHVKDATQDVAEDVLRAAEDGSSSVSGGKIIITPVTCCIRFSFTCKHRPCGYRDRSYLDLVPKKGYMPGNLRKLHEAARAQQGSRFSSFTFYF